MLNGWNQPSNFVLEVIHFHKLFDADLEQGNMD